jgi:radical SAM protein with 4Fe4S-binding SPASM domain
MKKSFVTAIPLPKFPLWDRVREKRPLLSFDIELTARCNNNCAHCCINLPAGDRAAQKKELSLEEIKEITNEAVSLGALWCLVTGGEPLLREDFFDVYLHLKKKGLLVSVFTNATLITAEHVKLFKKYPPRDIEVSVYGVTRETYESVTRKRGSFAAFTRGLDRCLSSGINVRLKAMLLRSNVHELPEIARFCREKTKDYFRFDPFLHLRYDGDPDRNAEIMAERLSASEIVSAEQSDTERFRCLERQCDKLITPGSSRVTCNHLFHCGSGNSSFTLGWDGFFRLCASLAHPDWVFDLRKGSLRDAWRNFVPQVREMRSNKKAFLEECRVCPLINLCMWCPANACLETGEPDLPIDYFCEVAHARAKAIRSSENIKD